MKIVVGGQMDKQEIFKLISEYAGSNMEIAVLSDVGAALAVQLGKADYYIGACATGAGAAIAMAIGILGAEYCVSLSIPGKIKSDEEISMAVKQNKKAYGFVNTDAKRIIPVLIKEFLNKENI